MSHPILVTGAAGGTQGSAGRLITTFLLKQGIPVRALAHDPQPLEEFFRENARFFARGTHEA
jgi:uncharacterized protein YbjT (DUF2867 family)